MKHAKYYRGATLGAATGAVIAAFYVGERSGTASGPADWPLFVSIVAFPFAGLAAGLIFVRLRFTSVSKTVEDYLRWVLATTCAFMVLGAVDAAHMHSFESLMLWLTIGALLGLGVASTVRFLREE